VDLTSKVQDSKQRVPQVFGGFFTTRGFGFKDVGIKTTSFTGAW